MKARRIGQLFLATLLTTSFMNVNAVRLGKIDQDRLKRCFAGVLNASDMARLETMIGKDITPQDRDTLMRMCDPNGHIRGGFSPADVQRLLRKLPDDAPARAVRTRGVLPRASAVDEEDRVPHAVDPAQGRSSVASPPSSEESPVHHSAGAGAQGSSDGQSLVERLQAEIARLHEESRGMTRGHEAQRAHLEHQIANLQHQLAHAQAEARQNHDFGVAMARERDQERSANMGLQSELLQVAGALQHIPDAQGMPPGMHISKIEALKRELGQRRVQTAQYAEDIERLKQEVHTARSETAQRVGMAQQAFDAVRVEDAKHHEEKVRVLTAERENAQRDLREKEEELRRKEAALAQADQERDRRQQALTKANEQIARLEGELGSKPM